MKKLTMTKPTRRTRQLKFEMTPAMQARMEAAAAQIGKIAEKTARKNDRIQREADKAMANTMTAWFEYLEENDPERIEQFFFEMGCFANATDRRRMFKHNMKPEGVEDRVQEQLDEWQAEAGAEKAAAEKAKQENEVDDFLEAGLQ